MKILAFVDLHGNKSVLNMIIDRASKEDIDVVICAGDFTVFGEDESSILEKLSKCGKPVLVVHGNHEEASNTKKACEKTKNCIFVHGGSYRIGSYLFIGWGGGGFSHKDSRLEEKMDKIKSFVEKDDKIILISHAPAYGTKVDRVGSEHAGSKSLLKLIERIKPMLAISGHIHETSGKIDKIGKTMLINPGAKGKVLIV